MHEGVWCTNCDSVRGCLVHDTPRASASPLVLKYRKTYAVVTFAGLPCFSTFLSLACICWPCRQSCPRAGLSAGWAWYTMFSGRTGQLNLLPDNSVNGQPKDTSGRLAAIGCSKDASLSSHVSHSSYLLTHIGQPVFLPTSSDSPMGVRLSMGDQRMSLNPPFLLPTTCHLSIPTLGYIMFSRIHLQKYYL